MGGERDALPEGGDGIPPCCVPIVGLVQRTRRDLTCQTCGEHYWYAPETDEGDERAGILPEPPSVEVEAPSRRPTPGAQPDARVQVAGEEVLRPSSVAPVARLTHVEDQETVRVRQLLCELRPDRGGPLGWGPSSSPPAPTGSAWTPAIRIQTSGEVPAILPGAFQSSAPASRAPRLDPDSTLGWLQRQGTLRSGLRALYAACADARATAEVRAKWKALAPKDLLAAAVIYGRKQVLTAMAEWWQETPSVDPAGGEAEGQTRRSAQKAESAGLGVGQMERASAAAEAMARVRGR